IFHFLHNREGEGVEVVLIPLLDLYLKRSILKLRGFHRSMQVIIGTEIVHVVLNGLLHSIEGNLRIPAFPDGPVQNDVEGIGDPIGRVHSDLLLFHPGVQDADSRSLIKGISLVYRNIGVGLLQNLLDLLFDVQNTHSLRITSLVISWTFLWVARAALLKK